MAAATALKKHQRGEEQLTDDEIRVARAKVLAYKEEQKLARLKERSAKAQEATAKAEEAAAKRSNRGPSKASQIGSGLVSGAKSTANAVKDVSNVVSGNKVLAFLIVAYLVHFADFFFFKYERTTASGISTMILTYFALAFLALWLLKPDGAHPLYLIASKKFFSFLMLSAVSFALPIILGYLIPLIPGTSNEWITLALEIGVFLSPPWAIFLYIHPHGNSKVRFIGTCFAGMWVLILFSMAVILLATRDVANLGGIRGGFSFNPLDSLSNLFNLFSDALGTMWSRIIGVGLAVPKFINANLNDTLGVSYSGQVDPYTQRDLGVRFSNLRSHSARYFEGAEVIVWADIEGESFKEEIYLSLRCFAVDSDGNLFEGIVQAQSENPDIVQISFKQKTFASCSFLEPSLPAGMYEVFFAGLFNFETWAYIQYYFSPFATLTNFWINDLDPATEFGIDSRPIAIYNSGPAMLGLASEIDQPIGVDLSDPSRGLPPFGGTLMNDWFDGEISTVRQISLVVPEPFILTKCDRKPTAGSRVIPVYVEDETPGYRLYSFENINDPNIFFESVTCFLEFESDAAAATFMGDFDLVLKTFVAKTEYLYEIKDSVRLRVE